MKEMNKMKSEKISETIGCLIIIIMIVTLIITISLGINANTQCLALGYDSGWFTYRGGKECFLQYTIPLDDAKAAIYTPSIPMPTLSSGD